MMVYLEPSSDKMACEIATALDESLTGRSIQVGDSLPAVADITYLGPVSWSQLNLTTLKATRNVWVMTIN